MAVSQVSIEEISKARSNYIEPEILNKATTKSKTERNYIEMLTDKQIENFFSKYGYVYHTHVNDEKLGNVIMVICNDCQIMFNDFTTLADFSPILQDYKNPTDFDYQEFEKVCQLINVTPSIAIGDDISINLLGKLPYYTDKKKEFDLKNIEAIKKTPFKDILKPSCKNQKTRSERAYIEKQYGSDDPHQIAETIRDLSLKS